MKVVRLQAPGGLDRLYYGDADDPGAPGPGQVRVRIHASSLNFHDYGVVSGAMPVADGRIPMSDGAGVVEAVGDGVDDFATGDHVVSLFFPGWHDGPPTLSDFATTPGDGVDGYASEVVVRPAHWFTRAPAGYSHAEAATLTTAGLTAWRALVVDGGIQAGETVLVLGSGGVSVFALQFARAMGARVIATSSSDAKLESLKALGAEHGINYRSQPEWGQAVLDWTGGQGVDHVIEVGGAGTLGQSIIACRTGGHVALIGVLAGLSAPISTRTILLKQQRVQGLIVGSRAHQLAMIRAIEATGLKPVIDSTHALADIADAFRHEASGAHFGKICLAL